MAAETTLTRKLESPFRAGMILAATALLAYLPVLRGEFLLDDHPSIRDNPAAHELSLRGAVRIFTEPATADSEPGRGAYRPLATLDLAIDQALSGGRPWLFRLRNLLYHILTGLLLLSLLRRLAPDDRRAAAAALAGALVFVLHPVQVQTAAWVSSRGNLLLGVLSIGTILLHVRGRRVAAAVLFAAALFTKEAAVVLPLLVLLVDRLRRAKPDVRAYAAYGALTLAWALAAWLVLEGTGRGIADPTAAAGYWGGSFFANLLTTAKGLLHYGRVILFPVHFTVDAYLPVSTGLDAGSAIALAGLAAVLAPALAAGPRSRFAVLWILVALFPVSNLPVPIGVPTAERFLYLPLAGVAIGAAPLLGRSRATVALLGCLLLLTFVRTLDWRSADRLLEAALEVEDTPRALAHRISREYDLSTDAARELALALPDERPAAAAKLRRHANRVVELTDRLVAFYSERIRRPPPDLVAFALVRRSGVHLFVGEPAAALEDADRALLLRTELPEANYRAGEALHRLGRIEEAKANLRRAAQIWRKRAARIRSDGDPEGAWPLDRRAIEADRLAQSIG